MKTVAERVAEWRKRNPDAWRKWRKPKAKVKIKLTNAERLAEWKRKNPEKHKANYNRWRRKVAVKKLIEYAKKNKDKIRKALKLK